MAPISDIETTTTSAAPKLSELARALMGLSLVLLLGAVGLGAIVFYIVNTIQDSMTLTLVFCLIGLGVLLATIGVGALAVYFVRRMGASLVEHQSHDNQALINAFAQLVVETRKTNEINQSLLSKALQAPLGAGNSTPPLGAGQTQQTVMQINTASRRRVWVYPLPHEGRVQQVRGDLIEAFVRWSFDETVSSDFRDYLREHNVTFSNDQYTCVREAKPPFESGPSRGQGWLTREGVLDKANKWTVSEADVWRAIDRMRELSRWQ